LPTASESSVRMNVDRGRPIDISSYLPSWWRHRCCSCSRTQGRWQQPACPRIHSHHC
jgi:hypothetical protein